MNVSLFSSACLKGLTDDLKTKFSDLQEEC